MRMRETAINKVMKLENRREIWNRLDVLKYDLENIKSFAQNEFEYNEEQLDELMFEFDDAIKKLNSIAKSIRENSKEV